MTGIRTSIRDGGAAEALPASLRRRYARAKAQRAGWEALWQDCYDYALPSRRGSIAAGSPASGAALRNGEKLFDGTASDAADQLAAALLAQLTPPWSRWFAFQPGRDVPEDQHGAVAAELDAAARIVQAQFDRSNLAVGCLTIRTGRNCCASPMTIRSSCWRATLRGRRWRAGSPISPPAPPITTPSISRRPGSGAARPAS